MNISTPSMQDLLSAGVHFGHKASRAHPKMKPFIFGARDGVDIIDLEKSETKLKEATLAAYELGRSGKVLLIVGTKKQAREILENLAKEVDTPYLTKRWYGGFLTNFEEIRKNFKKLINLKDEKEKGTLSRYTKKEQLLITRKLEKFERDAGGIANLEVIPNAIFIVDAVSDDTALKEAKKLGLTIIGICDTNADPSLFDFPVPANDDGIKSIKLICETIIKSYGAGKKELGKKNEQIRIKAEKEALKKEELELAGQVAQEAAAIEEEVEKEIIEESERKV